MISVKPLFEVLSIHVNLFRAIFLLSEKEVKDFLFSANPDLRRQHRLVKFHNLSRGLCSRGSGIYQACCEDLQDLLHRAKEIKSFPGSHFSILRILCFPNISHRQAYEVHLCLVEDDLRWGLGPSLPVHWHKLCVLPEKEEAICVVGGKIWHSGMYQSKQKANGVFWFQTI